MPKAIHDLCCIDIHSSVSVPHPPADVASGVLHAWPRGSLVFHQAFRSTPRKPAPSDHHRVPSRPAANSAAFRQARLPVSRNRLGRVGYGAAYGVDC